MPEENRVLNLYFCGTSGSRTQIDLFYEQDTATPLVYKQDTATSLVYEQDTATFSKPPQFMKMLLAGCGAQFGRRGLLFGHGLKKQVKQVLSVIDKIAPDKTAPLTVNALGFSRGAVGAMLLAKALGKRNYVTQNHLWFDPVPGNLICTQRMDFFNLTLARQVMDLSPVENFNRVTAIYTKEPLPDITCHAPIIPVLPNNCVQSKSNFYIVDGCHRAAFLAPTSHYFENTASQTSFILCKDMLKNVGVVLDPSKSEANPCGNLSEEPPHTKSRPVHSMQHQTLDQELPSRTVRAYWIPVTGVLLMLGAAVITDCVLWRLPPAVLSYTLTGHLALAVTIGSLLLYYAHRSTRSSFKKGNLWQQVGKLFITDSLEDQPPDITPPKQHLQSIMTYSQPNSLTYSFDSLNGKISC